MAKQFQGILLALVFLAGCQSQTKQALEFNNQMVAKETSLASIMREANIRMSGYLANADYEKIAADSRHIEELFQNKIDELESMPVPPARGAGEFKTAYIAYFNYLKSIYTGYARLGDESAAGQKTQILDDVQAIINKKDSVLEATRKSQQVFARANGFQVKN
jgi:hypothetical protein